MIDYSFHLRVAQIHIESSNYAQAMANLRWALAALNKLGRSDVVRRIKANVMRAMNYIRPLLPTAA